MKMFTRPRRQTFDVQHSQARIEVAPSLHFQSIEGALGKQSRKHSSLRKAAGDDGWRQRWFVLDCEMLLWYKYSADGAPSASEENFRGQFPLQVRIIILGANSATLLSLISL